MAPDTDEALRVEGLRYQRPADAGGQGAFDLRVAELALKRGEAVGVVGPSGCGKSTLVDLLALLRRPAQVARFELAGENVARLWERQDTERCAALRAACIGVVLQTGGLVPSLTVRENVLLSQRLLGRLDLAWVERLLRALDLGGLEARRPAQLSIGQRQRVAIARALAHRPALLLADEPTASLGVDHAPAALDLLLALSHETGAALLIVSHDLALLRSRKVPLRLCKNIEGSVYLLPDAR